MNCQVHRGTSFSAAIERMDPSAPCLSEARASMVPRHSAWSAESGRGLPHSTRLAPIRTRPRCARSVLECGSPLPPWITRASLRIPASRHKSAACSPSADRAAGQDADRNDSRRRARFRTRVRIMDRGSPLPLWNEVGGRGTAAGYSTGSKTPLKGASGQTNLHVCPLATCRNQFS